MKNFKSKLSWSGIILLALVGCSNPEPTTIQNNPSGSNNSQTASAPAKTSTTGNTSLLSIVSKTKTAVTSGNFAQAKKEFDKFEDAWKEVEDGIKAKSPKDYDVIETNLDGVTAELKASQPKKEKLITGLDSLEKTITAISKG